jgi:ribonuclease HI
MELMAICKALNYVRKKRLKGSFKIVTDYQMVVDIITSECYKLWISNDWHCTSGEVKNVDLWKKIIKLSIIYDVQYKHIPGHKDNEYNNFVDKLAVEERLRADERKGL